MTQIIRHSDLSKLSDMELELELTYTAQNHFNIYREINTRITMLIKQHRVVVFQVPTWKLHEDLSAAADRIEAIIEEIEYRQIP